MQTKQKKPQYQNKNSEHFPFGMLKATLQYHTAKKWQKPLFMDKFPIPGLFPLPTVPPLYAYLV